MDHIRMPRRRSTSVALRCGAALATFALVLTSCSNDDSTDPSATNQTNQAAEAMDPIPDRPQPADQVPEQPTRIAIIGYSNNPFFVNVKAGADAANAVLSQYNTTVDWINAGTDIDVPTVNTAVQSAGVQGYDGVGFFIAGDGNCPIIQTLTDDGVPVGVYNAEIECVEGSGGVIDYSQDSYAAGMNSAKELLAALDGKGGKVGIITNLFTSPSNEKRRQGFIDGLEGSNVTVVSDGVEAHDSASETSTAAKNYMQSTPDLVAIYCTAGGPFGAAEAVKAAGKQDEIKVIGYDITKENLAALRDGSLYGVTGQDAFGQGYNVAITLYNVIATGEMPDEVNVAAAAPFVTLDNLDDHDPDTQPLGTVGTS
ncbi:MAG: sugar ABC transporter substrate-binding protein [Arachnia sp.]